MYGSYEMEYYCHIPFRITKNFKLCKIVLEKVAITQDKTPRNCHGADNVDVKPSFFFNKVNISAKLKVLYMQGPIPLQASLTPVNERFVRWMGRQEKLINSTENELIGFCFNAK